MELSSAQVREHIKTGKGWRYLVPQGARAIIAEKKLYGLPAEASAAAETELTNDLIVRIEHAVLEKLSAGRFLHSRNTGLLAFDLCCRFGLPCRAGYLAGIAHDFAKAFPEEELLVLARKDGETISELEQRRPGLLHGRAAAVLLREHFGIFDEAIIEAVAYHTEGCINMGPLAKAVYIADKTEVSREHVEPSLRDLVFASGKTGGNSLDELDRIFTAVLEDSIAWLHRRGIDPAPVTVKLFEAVQKRKKA
jgi:nicotinate-nucleotide adenylyltransferase